MKKLQAIVFLIAIALSSCSKKIETTNNPPVNNQEPVLRPAGGDINYCKGCGSAADASFGCTGTSCTNNIGCFVILIHDYIPDPTTGQIAFIDSSYEVRDSFMVQYYEGQDYITYYYELSHLAQQNNLINSGNYLDYLSFGSQIVGVANAIRFGNDSDVPIDNTLEATAMSYINTFRASTTDETILGYLDNIEADLDQFTNKSVSYIRSELAN